MAKAQMTKAPESNAGEVSRAAHRLRRAVKAAQACLGDGHQGDFEGRAREAGQCLAELAEVVTGEVREHRSWRTLSPKQIAETLDHMLRLADKLTSCDLAADDVRRVFRSAHVSTPSRGLGEKIAVAAFDLHTVVSFPASGSLSKALTLAQHATRDNSAFTQGCVKLAKYAICPSVFGLANDTTAMLGEAVYQKHLNDIGEFVRGLDGLAAESVDLPGCADDLVPAVTAPLARARRRAVRVRLQRNPPASASTGPAPKGAAPVDRSCSATNLPAAAFQRAVPGARRMSPGHL